MVRMIQFEYKRFLRSNTIWYTLAFSLIISIWHMLELIIRSKPFIHLEGKLPLIQSFLGGDCQTGTPEVFRILVPLLAAIPFSWSYFEDYRSGYLKTVFSYTGRAAFLYVRYLVTFILGGAATVLPLIFSLILCAAYWPNYQPIIYELHGGPLATQFLAPLFYNEPFLYILFYILLMFIIGGACAGLGLFIGVMAKKRIQIYALPLLLILYERVFCERGSEELQEHSLQHMMNMLYGIRLPAFLCVVGLLIVLTWGGVIILGMRRDVLDHEE